MIHKRLYMFRILVAIVSVVAIGLVSMGGGGGCGSASMNTESTSDEGTNDDDGGGAVIPEALQVVSTFPAEGAVDIPLDSVVTATFSKAIDPTSIDGAAFVVEDESATAISGTVAYDDAESKLTFEPDRELERGGVYTARIAGEVVDVEGVALDSSYAWSFTADEAYYVSTAGDDAAAGTRNDPWQTIKHAVASVADFDTIRVLAGTYVEDEPVTIDKSITLEGEDRDSTILQAPATFGGSFENEVIVAVVGADDDDPDNIEVVIRGFTIDAQQTPGLRFGILLRGGAYAEITDNVLTGAMRSNGQVNSGNVTVGWNNYGYKARAIIRDNVITDFHSFGVAVYGTGNSAVIDNNEVIGNPDMHICSNNPGNWAGAMGIVIQSNDSATVTNNYFTNMRRNAGCDPASFDSAVELYSANDVIVDGNTFEDNDYGFGSYPSYMSGGLDMDNNEFIDNDVGAQFTGVTLNSFVDNIFTGNTVDTIP